MRDVPSRQRSAGFTLVELLIAVFLLTLLAMFASSAVSVIGASDAVRARPEAAAELSLVAQLVRLAGVAVLLFGGGFWYLAELHDPGRLDTFRIGHFLLLASTHALFFAVFGVLGAHELDAWLAVAVAAAVSYPLLVLHVARIVDPHFAWCSALPLAVLTTGSVVNGVYGGAARAFVWLGIVCLVVAVVTLTYPALARGWDARRERFEQGLVARFAALLPEVLAARELEASTRALLALQDPAELAGLRGWIEKRATAVREVLDAHERAVSLHEAMRAAPTPQGRRRLRQRSQAACDELAAQLRHVAAALAQATDTLVRRRQAAAVRREGAGTRAHCIACGGAVRDDGRFCSGCGARATELRRCRRCDGVLQLPHHLLRLDDGTPAATHCPGCGERHAG